MPKQITKVMATLFSRNNLITFVLSFSFVFFLGKCDSGDDEWDKVMGGIGSFALFVQVVRWYVKR